MANNINVSLVLKSKNFQAGLDRMSRKLEGIGKVSQNVGRQLQFIGALAVTKGLYDAADAALSLEEAMATLEATLGQGGDALAKLEASARELGKSTEYSASEIANMQVELAKAGVAIDDIVGADDEVVRIARAFGVDLQEAVKGNIQTFNQFKSQFSDQGLVGSIGKIGTVLLSVADATTASTTSLQAGLNAVGPSADAAGLSLEKTVAILGLLEDRGVEASKGGRGLRSLLSEIVNNGDNANEELDRLLKGTINIDKFTRSMGKFEASIARALFGLSSDFDKVNGSIDDSNDLLDRYAKILGGTTIKSIKRLQSAVNELGQKAFDRFGGSLRGAIDRLTQFINSIDEGDVKMAGAIAKIALFTKALSILQGVIGKVGLALTNFVKALSRLTPAGAIITGALAGIAIVVDSMNSFKSRTKAASDSVADLKKELSDLGEGDYAKKVEGKSFKSFEEFTRETQAEISRLSKARSDAYKPLFEAFGNQEIERVKALLESNTLEELLAKQRESASGSGLFSISPENLQTLGTGIQQIKALDAQIAKLNKGWSDAAAGRTDVFSGYVEPAKELTEEQKRQERLRIGAEAREKALADLAAKKLKAQEENTKLYEALDRGAGLDPFADNTTKDFADDAKRKFQEAEFALGLVEDKLSSLTKLQDLFNEAGAELTPQQAEQLDLLKLQKEALEELVKRQGGSVDFWNKQLEAEKARLRDLKSFGMEVRPMGFSEDDLDNIRQAQLEAKAFKRELDTLRESLGGLGLKMQEKFALNLTETQFYQTLLQTRDLLFNILDGIGNIAAVFAEGLVDPSKNWRDNVKDAFKDMIRGLVGMIAKVIALTVAITAGNALTGGAISAMILAGTAAGSVASGGPLSIANVFAQQFGGGRSNGMRSLVSGNDLVIASSRGYDINSRVYG